MPKSYEGGCASGAIRYEMNGEPLFQNHCQCLDCQKRGGTGHGSYLTFANRHQMQIAGEASTWRVAGDSGNEKIHAFCPTCGTPVYLTFAVMPDLIVIHAASLDDPGQFSPQALTYSCRGHACSCRGHAWDVIDPSLEAYEKMPAD